MEFYPNGRSPEEPFFKSMNQCDPYTYGAGMTDLRFVLGEVNPEDTDYGLHSLRVQGYNDSKSGNGEDITSAHGRWHSGSHTVYDRFATLSVLSMASRTVGGRDVYSAAAVAREISRDGTQRVVRQAAEAAGVEPFEVVDFDEDSEVEAAVAPEELGASLLPPGWTEVVRTASSRNYKVYLPPAHIGGPARPSRAAAWRAVDETRGAEAARGAVEGSGSPEAPVSSTRSSVVVSGVEGLAPHERRNLFPPSHEDNWGLARPDLSLPRLRGRRE